MTAYRDFLRSESIQLEPIEYDIVEWGCIVIGLCPLAGRGFADRACRTKAVGSRNVTVVVSGLSLTLRGDLLGTDAHGRVLLRWSISDTRSRTLFGQTITRIHGQITVAIESVTPTRGLGCAGAPADYLVELRLVDPQSRVDRFDGDRPLPNELRIDIASWFSSPRIVINTLSAVAGVNVAPPLPWPQPVRITLTGCVASAAETRRVTGIMWLDGPLQDHHLQSQVRFSAVAAEMADPHEGGIVELEVRILWMRGQRIAFEILLPRDLVGRVFLSGATDDDANARRVEFRVSGGRFGCAAPDFQAYNRLLLGCEPIDCNWTGLNDIGTLIGRAGGDPLLFLPAERRFERILAPLAGIVEVRALNNRDVVAGIVRLESGGVTGFVQAWDEEGAPRIDLVENVAFTALNSESVAVGRLDRDGGSLAVRWANGKIEPLDIPAVIAAPLAIGGGGTIAGICSDGAGEPFRAFLLGEQGFVDLGHLGGEIVGLQMNGAGVVAATVSTGEGLRGILLTEKGPFPIPLPAGAEGLALSGISDQGVAVGTLYGGGVRRAVRYRAETGLEFLDALAGSSDVALTEAIAINNLGQILAAGELDGEEVHTLLTPALMPEPEAPFPPDRPSGCVRCCDPPAAPTALGQPGTGADAAPGRDLLLVILGMVMAILLVAALLPAAGAGSP